VLFKVIHYGITKQIITQLHRDSDNQGDHNNQGEHSFCSKKNLRVFPKLWRTLVTFFLPIYSAKCVMKLLAISSVVIAKKQNCNFHFHSWWLSSKFSNSLLCTLVTSMLTWVKNTSDIIIMQSSRSNMIRF